MRGGGGWKRERDWIKKKKKKLPGLLTGREKNKRETRHNSTGRMCVFVYAFACARDWAPFLLLGEGRLPGRTRSILPPREPLPPVGPDRPLQPWRSRVAGPHRQPTLCEAVSLVHAGRLHLLVHPRAQALAPGRVDRIWVRRKEVSLTWRKKRSHLKATVFPKF